MKNLFLPLIGVAIFITVVGIGIKKLQSKSPNRLTYARKEIAVGTVKIMVEVADTDEKRQVGLSNRASLNSYSGMLFILPQTDTKPSFWMKDMLIPLDLLWIKGDKILQINQNIQPPAKDTPKDKLPLYRPQKPIDYVLEVNADFCETFLIHEGDTVDLSSIIPKPTPH